MTILVFGGSGMLGQALIAQASARGMDAIGASRHGSDLVVDIYQAEAVFAIIEAANPRLVINCAANTDLKACEADPGQAYMVNCRAVAVMAAACRARDIPFIHVSTDHYYVGDGAISHAENAPVTLVNEYARTKYAGEAMALVWEKALVVRTNVTGFRGWRGRPTFIEWGLNVIKRDEPVTLFDDVFSSTIDAASLSAAILDLTSLDHAKRILNIASRNVVSKKDFLCRLAQKLGKSLDGASVGSGAGLKPPRANSLGLDVSQAEALLGRALPDTDQVIDNLLKEYETADAV